jgi:hypothetical protein
MTKRVSLSFVNGRLVTRDDVSQEKRVAAGTKAQGSIHGGEFTSSGAGGGSKSDPSHIVAPLRHSVKKWRGQTTPQWMKKATLIGTAEPTNERVNAILRDIVGKAPEQGNVLKKEKIDFHAAMYDVKEYLGSRGAIGVANDTLKTVSKQTGELVLEGSHFALIGAVHDLLIAHMQAVALAAIGATAAAIGGPVAAAVAVGVSAGVINVTIHHLAEKIGFSPKNTKKLLVATLKALHDHFRLTSIFHNKQNVDRSNWAFDAIIDGVNAFDPDTWDKNDPRNKLPTHDAFEENKHPRGQPANAGEFSKVSVKAHGRTVHVSHVTINRNVETANAPTQLSWESTPGHTNHNLEGIHDAPIEQRREYHQAIQKVLLDEHGGDRIAQAFGFETKPAFDAPGIFEGRLNPGSQSVVQSYGQARPLTKDETDRLNASEAVRGALLRQDAAAWHHPQFFKSPDDAAKPYLIPTLTWRNKQYRGVTHQAAFQSMPKEVQDDFMKSRGNLMREPFGFIAPGGQLLNRFAARKYAENNGLLKPNAFNQPMLISEDLNEKAISATSISPNESNMVDFRAGRPLTDDEALAATKALSSLGGGFYSPIGTEQGFRLLNVPEATGLDNQAFMAQVVASLDGHPDLPDLQAYPVRAEAGYIDNDWKAHPHGESYRETIAALNRPDLVGTADTIFSQLGPRIAAVEDVFGLKYGWKPDRQTRFWEQAGTKKVVTGEPGKTLHLSDSRYSPRLPASAGDLQDSPALRGDSVHLGVRERHTGRSA